VRTIARESVYKTRVTDLHELKQRLGQLGLKLSYVVIAEAIRLSAIDNSRAVMHVLYTFSCNISHMLLSTGFNSGEIESHS